MSDEQQALLSAAEADLVVAIIKSITVLTKVFPTTNKETIMALLAANYMAEEAKPFTWLEGINRVITKNHRKLCEAKRLMHV